MSRLDRVDMSHYEEQWDWRVHYLFDKNGVLDKVIAKWKTHWRTYEKTQLQGFLLLSQNRHCSALTTLYNDLNIGTENLPGVTRLTFSLGDKTKKGRTPRIDILYPGLNPDNWVYSRETNRFGSIEPGLVLKAIEEMKDMFK